MDGGVRDKRETIAPSRRKRTKQEEHLLRSTLTHPTPSATPKRPLKGAHGVVRYTVGRREIVSHGMREIEEAVWLASKFMADPTRSNSELYVAVERPSYHRIPVGIPPHKMMPVKKHEVHRPRGPNRGNEFAVSRVQSPYHVVLLDGLPTLAEAWEAARPYVRRSMHNDVLYFIERRGLAIAVSDTPYVPAGFLQEDEDDKYPWELKEAHGDMSLLSRQSDELGLGIPAQWGKGRHNRKGPYIP